MTGDLGLLRSFATLEDICLVCGSGPSFDKYYDRNWIQLRSISRIMVNDTGLDFDPVEMRCISDDLTNITDSDRAQRILNTSAPFVLTAKPDLPFQNALKVPYKFRNYKWDIQESFDRKLLVSCVTTTEIAISFAIYSGFKQIGILGWDLIGHPSESQAIEINKFGSKIFEYCKSQNIRIHNLSDISLVDTIPYLPFNKFKESLS